MQTRVFRQNIKRRRHKRQKNKKKKKLRDRRWVSSLPPFEEYEDPGAEQCYYRGCTSPPECTQCQGEYAFLCVEEPHCDRHSVPICHLWMGDSYWTIMLGQ